MSLSKQPQNPSKQLHIQVQQIEATKDKIKQIWQHQSRKNKLMFGVSAIVAAGFVLVTGKKYTATSLGYLRQFISTFALMSRIIILQGAQKLEEENS